MEWIVPGYSHIRPLGSGASGRVVLAVHEATGTPVAIKYLSEELLSQAEFREMFREEAQQLGRLVSPHVVRLWEYVEGPRGVAIVMELVDGIPLRALLHQEGATGPEAALVVLKGSLLGLAAAHGVGVVHRDYKPENVLVARNGSSKLVDFGVAVPSGHNGGIAGTPPYMAPEQWIGDPASPAADVYAATATFFECLTGTRPYGGTTFVELAVQHRVAPIPAVLAPDAVRPLIRRGLAKAVSDRPPSAMAFVQELEAVAGAAYGHDWEERGQRKIAALAALLPLLFPSAGVTPTHTTVLEETGLPGGKPRRAGRMPRKGVRRMIPKQKLLVGGIAGGVVLGVLAGGFGVGMIPLRDKSAAAVALRLSASVVANGSTFVATASGFTPGEEVRFSWSERPGGAVLALAVAGPNTSVSSTVSTAGLEGGASATFEEKDRPGFYVMRVTGLSSGRSASASFQVIAAGATRPPTSGGSGNGGGSATGGSSTTGGGGSTAGGATSGGATSGGTATGGTSTNGTSTGGSTTGGTSTSGSTTGGTSSGGSTSQGTTTGGSSTEGTTGDPLPSTPVTLTFSSSTIPYGSGFTASGSGFEPGETVVMTNEATGANFDGASTADGDGNFTDEVSELLQPGDYTFWAIGQSSGRRAPAHLVVLEAEPTLSTTPPVIR
ncbi:serine/threonine-protein kinase [Streptomyces sp. H39-S7]|uniref:serine/threonine-protein kinase n=1 Tax=Streptomyces sp. H39-S7 TaxID=3004357 RepID=UPI0022AE8BB8|nr:serine/threonine-protein kinase [Streptomyces sp. H39-S7]MCZ4125524.1 serine/threonine-protein kinase [Streptomyces sp. H39-S7]